MAAPDQRETPSLPGSEDARRPLCLVTGGAKRLGAAIARHLANQFDLAIHFNKSMAEAAALRGQHLEALGHSNHKDGLDEVARQHPALASSITALLDTAREAQALNASNGRLIEQFMSQNQETLDALQRLMGNGPLYDSSGRSRRAGPANTVIKAG